MSENTIRLHLKNIYEKLGATNRTEAGAWYFRSGKGRNERMAAVCQEL
jgi:DNA-binding NarL/FixJ family response regulator